MFNEDFAQNALEIATLTEARLNNLTFGFLQAILTHYAPTGTPTDQLTVWTLQVVRDTTRLDPDVNLASDEEGLDNGG